MEYIRVKKMFQIKGWIFMFYENENVKLLFNLWVSYYAFYRCLRLVITFFYKNIDEYVRISNLEEVIFESKLLHFSPVQFSIFWSVLFVFFVLTGWFIYKIYTVFRVK